jgi:YidC/Oxa1 family membrane protein insertase
LPIFTGKSGGSAEVQPLAGIVDDTSPAAKDRTEEKTCAIDGPRFRAELSSKGGVLKHAWMLDGKYRAGCNGGDKPIDLVTTWVQARMPLRTSLRMPGGAADQVRYDDLDWTIAQSTPTRCVFHYRDDAVEMTKTIASTERPFELAVALSVVNRATEPKKHRLTIEQTDYRTAAETEGSWGRVSEHATNLAVRTDKETVRLDPTDFEPGDFNGERFTVEKWARVPGQGVWAAASSSYFSKAIIALLGPSTPAAEMLVEEVWDRAQFPDKAKDPKFGHVYRARLAYDLRPLAPGEEAEYKFLAYVGPKEREVLAHVGGAGHDAIELLDLGMFGWIGKMLIRYMYLLYGLVGTWGIAICLLTITVKVVLFPLSIAQIKSMMAMRKLKPEMDAINAKYKDDAQQRGLALQELWRKNKVANPALGCLPVLLQMPVWFALYTALQTAVELYHTPFGPLIPDLSAPDRYYAIPIVLGASSFLQQHLMPMQGDAMQQKMMKYMMPVIFTVMMLFLPAGLGIYFLTNTWLGIGQQVAVERYYQSRGAKRDEPGKEPAGEPGEPKTKALGKGKSRVQQRG